MANGMANGSDAPTGIELELSNLNRGLEKLLSAGAALVVNGTLYSQAQVVALVLEVLGPYEAVRVAKSKLIGAIHK